MKMVHTGISRELKIADRELSSLHDKEVVLHNTRSAMNILTLTPLNKIPQLCHIFSDLYASQLLPQQVVTGCLSTVILALLNP